MTVQPALERARVETGTRHRAFRDIAREMGLNPDDRWVGGYVDYEWQHLRPVLDAYGIKPDGRRALEFGCNYGASGIVLARLDAQVTGVDVSVDNIRLAQANLELHGMEGAMRVQHVPDTRAMPFEDKAFDLVIANSVLEYVDPAELDGVMAEIARVLRPGGFLLVLGTASRLAPRETHSGRWLVNYTPRLLDRLTGRELQRGLSPLLLARSLNGRFAPIRPRSWLAARKAVHGKAAIKFRLVDRVARMAGIAPGWISPNIELLLKRL